MKFPYARISYHPQNGHQFSVLRPIIPIGLRYKGKVFGGKYMALVDSGADDCILHAQIGASIDIDVKAGRQKIYAGVGFGASTGYLHNVEIQVGGWWFPCRVAFSYDLIRRDPNDPKKVEGLHYGVLGQEGFFDKFRVSFDRVDEQLELKPKDPALLNPV